MALIQTFPNQFQSEDCIYSTATSTASGNTGFAFGFRAVRVQIYNDKATPVYVTWNSTTGSTGGHRTCASESILIDGMPTVGCAIGSTTTTTATNVRVLALGW